MTSMYRIAGLVLLAMAVAVGDGRADGSAQAVKARAMLDRAVAAVQANEQAALESFTKGTNGFADGDLYPFCARARSGWVVAHPSRLGENLANVADVNGKLFGKEILNTAKVGEVKEIHYMWPKPGHRTPERKDTFYVKVGHLVCGVGYYP
jgi:signal transduction histidine kinase